MTTKTDRPRRAGPALRRCATLVAVLLGTSGWAAASALPAAAVSGCTSGVRGDVNGDGYAEVAVGEPGKRQERGAVHVFGQPGGLVTNATGTAPNDQYFTEDTPGVPGRSEVFAIFGDQVRLGDFDHDGCADLATVAVGTTASLIVLYGSPAGITTAGAQQMPITQPVSRGGVALAVADLDHDGIDDLAATATDRVLVTYGDTAGLGEGLSGRTVLGLDSPEVPAAVGAGFGTGLATGDFDGDGRDELAVGVLGARNEGAVLTLERGTGGFLAGPLVSMRTTGVPRGPERYERFGTVTATGDVDADGRDDLVVGLSSAYCGPACEEETEGAGRQADGAVVLLRGTARGLTGTGSQVWTQDSPGVSGMSAQDGFGASLAVGHLDTGPAVDVAVGVPGATVEGRREAGSVTLLLGSRHGLTTAGAGGSTLSQQTAGLSGSSERGDRFGSVLWTAEVQGTAQDNLVVGVPNEAIGGARASGQIHQLAVGPSGPQGRGSRSLSPATAGVIGQVDQYDGFGGSLG